MINYVTEKSYAACVDALEKKLSERVIDLDVRHIVVVPDVYTFELEKRLMLARGGAFDVEVTTFSRLYAKFASGGERAIGKQSAIMLVKRICREHASELSCYSRSVRRQGFGGMLYEAITSLRSCGITADDLNAAAKKDSKIADLALLYAAYEKETEGKYVDSSGKIALLRKAAAKSDYFNGACVYVALYDVLPVDVTAFLRELGGIASSVTVYSAARKERFETTRDVKIYKCADDVREYKTAAKIIRSYLIGGGSPSEVAVVDGRGDFAVMRRVFEEYGIPYYADYRISLDETELGRFVFGVIECAEATRRQEVVKLALNRYCGLSEDERAAFCDYVRERAVDYKGFDEPFENEIAERGRKKVIKNVCAIRGKTDGANVLARALIDLLGAVGARELTEKIGELDDRAYGQVYDKAVEIIRSFGELGSTETEDDEGVADVLREGFGGTEISLVPNASGTVTVADLQAFRGRNFSLAIVVGFNEGVMPSRPSDDGLIADSDADELEKYKLKITPRADEKAELCRDELKHFLSGAKRLVLTYVEEDGGKPSYELIRLARSLKADVESSEPNSEQMEDAEFLTEYLSTGAGAFEAVAINPTMPHAGSAYEASGTEVVRVSDPADRLAERSVLVGSKTSVSALQTYFLCPYMYFMRYGLKVKKQDEGEVSPIDVGLLLHKLAERYVALGYPPEVEDTIERELPAAVDEFVKYKYAENAEMLGKVKKEAIALCKVVRNQIIAGSFVPEATEKSFGKDDEELKTVTIAGVKLVGGIDRIDGCGNLVRVIDYKTGSCDFDYADLYSGKKIQLALYLKILVENGRRPAGAFYFPLKTAWSDDEYSHRLIGPFSVEHEALLAADPTLIGGGKSTVVRASSRVLKSGKTDFFRSQTARTESELTALADYAAAVAEGAINELKGGYIAQTPLAWDGRSACESCDYAATCARCGRKRAKKNIGADEIIRVTTEDGDVREI